MTDTVDAASALHVFGGHAMLAHLLMQAEYDFDSPKLVSALRDCEKFGYQHVLFVYKIIRAVFIVRALPRNSAEAGSIADTIWAHISHGMAWHYSYHHLVLTIMYHAGQYERATAYSDRVIAIAEETLAEAAAPVSAAPLLSDTPAASPPPTVNVTADVAKVTTAAVAQVSSVVQDAPVLGLGEKGLLSEVYRIRALILWRHGLQHHQQLASKETVDSFRTQALQCCQRSLSIAREHHTRLLECRTILTYLAILCDDEQLESDALLKPTHSDAMTDHAISSPVTRSRASPNVHDVNSHPCLHRRVSSRQRRSHPGSTDIELELPTLLSIIQAPYVKEEENEADAVVSPKEPDSTAGGTSSDKLKSSSVDKAGAAAVLDGACPVPGAMTQAALLSELSICHAYLLKHQSSQSFPLFSRINSLLMRS